MYHLEESHRTSIENVEMADEEDGIQPYGSVVEFIWGILLLIGILLVNLSVLWVVARSRELWKPRHLWMACLCITDIFVGAHKALELLIFAFPYRELCILQRATLGIPYVVNMLILSLLSLDRFIAVRYPFFYSASISNKHVLVGFLVVLLAGGSLAAVSVSMGLRDPVCRAQGLQLVYLTIVLTICSVLTLFFNSSVLRIAKKQLNAIYAQDPSLSRGRRKVSVVCTNCGYKNETFVNTLLPIPVSTSGAGAPPTLAVNGCKESFAAESDAVPSSILPLADAVVLGPMDLELSMKGYAHALEKRNDESIHLNGENDENSSPHIMSDETTAPLVRTVSLPTIHDKVTFPISVVVQPDPSLRPTVVLGNLPADVDLGCKIVSMSNIENNCCIDVPVTTGTLMVGSSGVVVKTSPQQEKLLPRSRSLMTCRTHKVISPGSTAPRLQLFRNLHLARANMFHVGRLFPSIRFARTVLLIMIPMWLFILPIVTIIPLHRGCESQDNTIELNCDIVSKLWGFLHIHMRSILPIQAILDTFLYAFGSKEFRQALRKLLRKFQQPKL